MQEIRMDALGGPEVLRLVEADRPEPLPTEVLVRVRAAGINPVDTKSRATGPFIGELPFVLGWDVAGVVEAVGFGVTRFAPGDRVLGMPWFPRPASAYAEFVTAPSRQFARIPDGMGDAEAAGLPLAGLTAWQALVDTAHVGEGTRVLVHAAAGGVGHLAVQIAKAAGAHVIGTASARHHDWLRSLGADELVDYTAQEPGEVVRDADVMLDLVGGDVAVRSLPAMRDGGLVITIPSGEDVEPIEQAAAGRVEVTGFLVEPDRTSLEALTDLIERGLLTVTVAGTFPLADAAAAHAEAERGRGGGKLVLTVG